MTKGFIAQVAGALWLTSNVFAAPGDLDPTFSLDGKVNIGFGASGDFARAVAGQADGKIVVAGSTNAGPDSVFALARYNPDGSADLSFGDSGRVLTNIAPRDLAVSGSGLDEASGVAIQADGKIVVAGQSRNGTNAEIALVRYEANGSLDTSFGAGGKVTTDFSGQGSFTSVGAVRLQGDGKIVVGGWTYSGANVATVAVRYTSNGALDTTFNGTGKASTVLAAGNGNTAGMTLQPDGKILVATSVQGPGGVTGFRVVRYGVDGTLDSSFDMDGQVLTQVGLGDTVTSIAIQPGNNTITNPDRIVVAGYTFNGAKEVFAAVRYNFDGSLDTSFDTDGKVTTEVSTGTITRCLGAIVEVTSLITRKITLAGLATRPGGTGTITEIAVVRYNSNGSLDTTFDTDGIVLTNFNGSDTAAALTRVNGKIVVAGNTFLSSASNRDFAIARYNGDGLLDTTFDQDGKKTDDFGGDGSVAKGVLIQPDGKILAAGSSGGAFPDFALVRLNPDGTFDTSFDGDGKVAAALGTDAGNAVALQPDGGIILAGSRLIGSTTDLAVARFNPNGSPDTTFAGGVATTPVGSGADAAQAVAIQPDGKIIAAGFATSANRDVAIARFNANGSLDSSFEFDGKVSIGFASGNDEARGVAIQPDGKILIAGYADNSPSQFFVGRLNVNGTLDNSFNGGGGTFTTVGPGNAGANALNLSSNGRIAVAGYASNGTNYDFALIRYRADGSLDPSFGNGGIVTTPISAGDDVATALAVQADGKLVVVGQVHPETALGIFGTVVRGSFAVVRYLPNGTIDQTYGTGGKVLFGFDEDSNDGAFGLALDANGKAVIAGQGLQLFGVARVDPGVIIPPGLVANVSTRLPVGTDDSVLIEGFIVQGPSGSTKKIMVRAIGPSLAPFGIPDALGNPTLEIRDANNTLIATNDDWGTTQVGGIIPGDQSAEISGSGLAPSDTLESAIIANLSPGNYTAVVRGLGNTTGTGVVDAYDMGAASPTRLANIATRGLIQPGDKLMIAGFIIQNGPLKAVVLATGPSLSAFGITNALPDTTLQLRDQNGAIVRENDDWQSDQKQELESIGLQPTHDREAALVETIQPGQYTAQVRGKGEASGIGVVQVYFLE